MTRKAKAGPGVLTKSQFERLSAFKRGYCVYMAGCRRDQPNVPNEANPYPEDSRKAKQWERGALAACMEVQDSGG